MWLRAWLTRIRWDSILVLGRMVDGLHAILPSGISFSGEGR